MALLGVTNRLLLVGTIASLLTIGCGGNIDANNGDVYNLNPDPQNPLPPNNPPPNTPTPPPGGKPVDTFTNFAKEKMQTHCVGCHLAYGNYNIVANNAGPIKQTTANKSMPPPGSPPMPQADIDRLKAWFDAGAPQ